ncbi:MAG: hypothetical protein INR73_25755 [Williamsia sp.]|nr:hypothetical protein [Williamsia sp.]
MKWSTLFFIISLLATCSYGQVNFKKNAIYLEAGGNGLFTSVNYERQLTNQPGIGLRVGVGFYTENAFYLTIPAGINCLFKLKQSNSFIDAGLGTTWSRLDGHFLDNTKDANGNHFVSFVPSIGYRQQTENGLMWRIGLTPIANKYGFIPWLGFSAGKRF